MKQKIILIIKRHYKKHPYKWEKCGEEIEKLIRIETEKLYETSKFQNAIYPQQCKMKERIRNEIESIYESFFSLTNYNGNVVGYDWINGNNKLKTLLN